jgi:hypothetical protein
LFAAFFHSICVEQINHSLPFVHSLRVQLLGKKVVGR